MNTKDNLYVNAADVCLSMVRWPQASCVEIHAEVDHPVRTINLDEYTKKVQDDMMEALRVVLLSDDYHMREAVVGVGETSVTLAIHKSSGHEFMERYEKWKKKSDAENKLFKLLREQIDAEKKLLREHGFEVVTV